MGNLIVDVPAKATDEYDLYIKPFLNDPAVDALPMTYKLFKLGIPREIYFNNSLDKVMREKGNCGWNFVGGVNFTKKTLTPVEVAFAIEQCYKVFEGTIFADGLPDGYKRGELSPELVDFMNNQFINAINGDLLTAILLGDTSISEGTPYYSIIDGVYKKLSALAGGDYDAGAITDNDLLPANIEATMYRIYNQQSEQLRGIADADKYFMVTGSVYDAWRRFVQLQTKTDNGQLDRESILKGVTATSYNGSELVPVRIVDRRLKQDFKTGSPATVAEPHRVIYTVPGNHFVGMDGSAFKDINMWYENKDDKVYEVASALIVYEYGYDELNVIAGFGDE